ncbi:MAG: yhjD 1, partial [Pseudonocardiales bacterium]|nr:yhjD 1 [Pseudonocardiales bacterium]
MLTRLKDRGVAIWTSQRSRRDWLDHSVRAWTQLGQTNGSLLAGALTFFSFLALFPLILLAVAIAGFVFASNPSLEQDLFNKIAEQAPGKFGDTIKEAITTAIDAKTGVGLVALAGVLLTGLGWVNNLRQATEQVWGHKPP